MDFKREIAGAVASALGGDAPDGLYDWLEVPADAKMGDYAFPCFRLAKALKAAPPAIAARLAAEVAPPAFVRAVAAAGGYLNFFVKPEALIAAVLTDVHTQGERYGASDIGAGKAVVFDYSSPNIAKQLHIGHLYTTVIGAALYRMYGFLGYNAVGINYLGDWGTQFGKMIVAYKLWGEGKEVDSVEAANRLYVRYHDEAEHNPDLENQARAWLMKMQTGDDEALALWQKFRALSLTEIEKTYKRLGIAFDSYRGESYYNDKMAPVVDEIRDKGLLTESDGAQIVDLSDYKLPPCLILRSDGGTLYPTRDIASALDRWQLYHFHKAVYITDVRQAGHFAQFFKVLELMGYDWAKDLVHVPYGLLSIEGGALSSRHGNVVLLEDLFDEAAERVLAIINEKNPELPDKAAVAEQVGQGAVIFATLYNNRIKDVDFYWDRILNFDGETGPYVQYTHARCAGVLEKAADTDYRHADLTLLTDDATMAAAKLLAAFPDKIRDAAAKYEPFLVSRALVEICYAFNRFYHENNVLGAAPALRDARLYFVSCVKAVLSTGLRLLGIAAPERM